MDLRPATSEDLPVLREFEQGVIKAERPLSLNLKPDPIHYYDLEHMLASDKFALLVGELDQQGIGRQIVACGYARLDKSAAHFQSELNVYMGFMYVIPEQRGKGLSGQLMQALIEWGKEQGATEARLDVYASNEPAIRAYEKAGFKSMLLNMRKII